MSQHVCRGDFFVERLRGEFGAAVHAVPIEVCSQRVQVSGMHEVGRFEVQELQLDVPTTGHVSEPDVHGSGEQRRDGVHELQLGSFAVRSWAVCKRERVCFECTAKASSFSAGHLQALQQQRVVWGWVL